VVEGTRRSVERRQLVARPSHRVGDTPATQPVELALVAMSEGIPQFDQVLVHGPVTAAVRGRPSASRRLEATGEPADAEPPEVLLDAAHVGVAAVDQPPLSRGGDEKRPELRRRFREVGFPTGIEPRAPSAHSRRRMLHDLAAERMIDHA
jgi:hypothetical protein